ncbi:single-stranded DNA-binding protein [Actinoplanes sp. RD1]|uniref:single-stranded DNA-binding protein n=1 Tax=Actinoplanes sp. RD1 TaxID=3064538 RepID=UPI002742636B|nr:single-stranded DNA-binding protein [Actinoplanes sp. RD1]
MQFDLTFEGNVADHPEVRFTPAGNALCRFRVGHNTRRRTNAGEWVNGPTIWFTVTAWRELAERVAESIRMGDTVIVTARNDLSVFAYTNRTTSNPAADLQVTAANVAISLRFAEAQSMRKPKPASASASAEQGFEDPWDTQAAAELDAEPVG